MIEFLLLYAINFYFFLIVMVIILLFYISFSFTIFDI